MVMVMPSGALLPVGAREGKQLIIRAVVWIQIKEIVRYKADDLRFIASKNYTVQIIILLALTRMPIVHIM